MIFRDLKPGGPLYIYDRLAVTLTTDKISSVSAPRMDKANPAAGLVVDIAANNTTYTLKDAAEIGYAGALVISPEKAAILREIEMQKANDENLLARVDTIKSELAKFDAIIDQLSPERKERKQQEERMNKIETTIGELKNMVEQLVRRPQQNR